MTGEERIFEAIADCERKGTPAVLVTVVRVTGSAPRKEGAKMLVVSSGETLGTVGGARLEAMAVETAREILRLGQPRMMHYNLNDLEGNDTKMVCGGGVDLFFDPVSVGPWLYLFGAGHCGKSIAEAAHAAGFPCVVVDERPAYAAEERFPFAMEIHCGDPPTVARALSYRPRSFIVIATYCFEMDVETAIGVLARGMPEYLGIIGSRKKREEMRKVVAAEISDEDFARIRMPMGIDIGAEKPEEIAVSVVAELIRQRKWAGGEGAITAERPTAEADRIA